VPLATCNARRANWQPTRTANERRVSGTTVAERVGFVRLRASRFGGIESCRRRHPAEARAEL